jgi:hypothetical protein
MSEVIEPGWDIHLQRFGCTDQFQNMYYTVLELYVGLLVTTTIWGLYVEN